MLICCHVVFLCAASLYAEVNKVDYINHDELDAFNYGVGGGSSKSGPEGVLEVLSVKAQVGVDEFYLNQI